MVLWQTFRIFHASAVLPPSVLLHDGPVVGVLAPAGAAGAAGAALSTVSVPPFVLSTAPPINLSLSLVEITPQKASSARIFVRSSCSFFLCANKEEEKRPGEQHLTRGQDRDAPGGLQRERPPGQRPPESPSGARLGVDPKRWRRVVSPHFFTPIHPYWKV